MQSASALSFGRAIADLRRRRGLKQKEVVARIPTRYADVNAYGRIERGERHPDRDDVLAILVHGIGIASPADIDSVLALGGYAGLADAEIKGLKLSSETSEKPGRSHKNPFWPRVEARASWTGLLLIPVLASLSVFIVRLWAPDETLFILLSSLTYAALYVISLLLESTFQADQRGVVAASTFAFCFILLSSVVALSLDAYLVRIGSPWGLLVAIIVFLAAALGQWMMTRTALADVAVVPTTYPSHTAQAAHLKNTVYFIGIVLIYWAPSAHAVAILRREVQRGDTQRAHELTSRPLLIGPNVFSLNVSPMLVAFAGMVVYFLMTRGKLLDNLMARKNRNRYVALFYWRVTVYFLLVLGCIAWFATALASL